MSEPVYTSELDVIYQDDVIVANCYSTPLAHRDENAANMAGRLNAYGPLVEALREIRLGTFDGRAACTARQALKDIGEDPE